MIIYRDPAFHYLEYFNEENGSLLRTNILDKNGNETISEPKFRSYPELLDVGIMGTCANQGKTCARFGVDCYQGYTPKANMKLDDYKSIVRQSSKKTFQIALGGRGDPNKHPDFDEICRYTREYGIIPNLTTSGVGITDKEISTIKKYCGAVAISWYSKLINGIESNPQTIDSFKRLVYSGCKTNIHYVVSKDTIGDLIFRLRNNLFPDGMNALILLLYKPIGEGKINKSLNKVDSISLKELFDELNKEHKFKIGFDSCFTPLVKLFLPTHLFSIETCEAARFSAYISSEMKFYPCSFGANGTEFIDLKEKTIETAWHSAKIRKFVMNTISNCSGCVRDCKEAGCPLGLNQTTCK